MLALIGHLLCVRPSPGLQGVTISALEDVLRLIDKLSCLLQNQVWSKNLVKQFDSFLHSSVILASEVLKRPQGGRGEK